MEQQPGKPTWWKLDAIFIGMLVMLALYAWWSHGAPETNWMLLPIVLIGYGFVAVWIYANGDALSQSDDKKDDPIWHNPAALDLSELPRNDTADDALVTDYAPLRPNRPAEAEQRLTAKEL
jgi:hypothetical protein